MVVFRWKIQAAIGWIHHTWRGRPTTGYGRSAAVQPINLELEAKMRQETQYGGATPHSVTPRDLFYTCTLGYIREENRM